MPRMPPANCSKMRRSNFHCQPAVDRLAATGAADVLDHVVEVVGLRRHGAEPRDRPPRPSRRSRGAPNACFRRKASTSGSGSVTGESHTITPVDPVGVQRRGGDRDEAAHAVADHDGLAGDAAARRRRPPPPRSTARWRSASRWSLSPWPDRSRASTRNSSANVAATWVHQCAWAPPPWTNTSPRRPARPRRGSGCWPRRPRRARR